LSLAFTTSTPPFLRRYSTMVVWPFSTAKCKAFLPLFLSVWEIISSALPGYSLIYFIHLSISPVLMISNQVPTSPLPAVCALDLVAHFTLNLHL
jgi:hypothetical protein